MVRSNPSKRWPGIDAVVGGERNKGKENLTGRKQPGRETSKCFSRYYRGFCVNGRSREKAHCVKRRIRDPETRN